MAAVAAVPTWPELLGSSDWLNYLNPLPISLRQLILQCGDLCQATYDAFINDRASKFCGASRYGKSQFFHRVSFRPSLQNSTSADYSVVSFFYATARVSVPEAFILHSLSREAWDRESNWMGFVAVTSDEHSIVAGRREIYVAWRGTTRNYEWVDVLGADLESIAPLLKPGGLSKETPKVMRGWLSMYISENPNSAFTKQSAKTQLRQIIKQLVTKYKDERVSIIITGHSLGASLSIINAFDIVENIVTSEILVTAFVFGCPQVGNKLFNKKLKSFPNLKILHVRNTIDLIPHYPGELLGYAKTGIELVIDSRKSDKLKDSKNPSDWHNLQAMLHVVAGWNGEKEKFEMKVKRSLALVNKSSAILKDEELVPESWWVEKNKGMVCRDDGEWVQVLFPDDYLPEFEF